MSILNVINAWLQNSEIYEQYLKNAPVPLNNIFFDTLLLLAIIIYIVYRVLVYIRCSHTNKVMHIDHDKKLEESVNKNTDAIEKTSWW